jgi:FkbM family methyltransferase
MQLKDIEALNAAALKATRERPGNVEMADYPFYGYYEVDLFESPPFLMFTNNDCPRAENIFYLRHFEPHSMKLWCRLARTATGIVDIGAHVGVYSLAAAALRPDLQIHAFEPNPHAYGRLRVHKMINGFTNIVEHTVAAGDTDGFVQFAWVRKPTLAISSGGSVTQAAGDFLEKIVVPMQILDNTKLASELGNRPLVKIDVEGGEIATINGMKKIIALKPDMILETFNQQACDTINAILLPMGYSVYHVLESAGRIERRERLTPCEIASKNFNHLLSMRSSEEVALLSG